MTHAAHNGVRVLPQGETTARTLHTANALHQPSGTKRAQVNNTTVILLMTGQEMMRRPTIRTRPQPVVAQPCRRCWTRRRALQSRGAYLSSGCCGQRAGWEEGGAEDRRPYSWPNIDSVARSPGRTLRKLGDPTFLNATREGAISDTVAREGGSSTHRTQCPHFHATGDYCTSSCLNNVFS